MYFIKLGEDEYINRAKITDIYISPTGENGYRIKILLENDNYRCLPSIYKTQESACEGLLYLKEFIERNGTNLSDYRELDGFEREVWDTYCKTTRDMRLRLVAKCMLICSDPDAILIVKPSDICGIMMEMGFPWCDYSAIVEFQNFLDANTKAHAEWFEVRE